MTDTPTPPKYFAAVLDLAAGIQPGEARALFVLHDAHCDLLADVGACNCNPVVTRGFVLWFRKGRGHAWEAITTAPSSKAAYDAIKASGRKNGDWQVLPTDGKQP